MALCRLGSLNALEQTQGNSFWKKWLGGSVGSADTQGRVFSLIDCEKIRGMSRHIYTCLKRNKALRGTHQGMCFLVLDGHEQSCGYLRGCEGCCVREVGKDEEKKLQNYHRYVAAMLVCGQRKFLMDVESQRPGEDEVACATRLLERLLRDYPRAFDVVIGDGLYARGNFFNMVLSHNKEAIAVLKDERRDLLKDAMGIFNASKPVVNEEGKISRQLWDEEDFQSWDGFGGAVRVVRSVETKQVRRQKTGKIETQISEWMWATTLSKSFVTTETIVAVGHGRWSIENEGFNELVNLWHADHLYKHEPNAIEAFLLTQILAYNLFHSFFELNLKPAVRLRHTLKYIAELLKSALNVTSPEFEAMQQGP